MKDRPKRLPDKIKPGTNGDVGYRGCMRLPAEESERHAKDHQTLNRKANYVFDVMDYGAEGDGYADDTEAISAALSAAAASGGGLVSVPPGQYLVDAVQIPNYLVSLKGSGSTLTSFIHSGTGPVVDFSSWTANSNYLTTAQYGGFSIVGNGSTAGEVGLNVSRAPSSVGVARFDDVAVRGTGGHALYAERLYLSVFRDCIFGRPDGIDDGYNVPYVELKASNGTRMFNCGFRSTTSRSDAPAGMLRLSNSQEYVGHDLVVSGCWTEYAHPNTVGIYVENNTCILENWSFFDMGPGADDTAWVEFAGSGNVWRSMIPGSYTMSGHSGKVGMRVSGSRNRIEGIKGYPDTAGSPNIVFEPGASYNAVLAAGADSGVPGNPGVVVDRSGTATNVLLDLTNGNAALTILDGVS